MSTYLKVGATELVTIVAALAFTSTVFAIWLWPDGPIIWRAVDAVISAWMFFVAVAILRAWKAS